MKHFDDFGVWIEIVVTIRPSVWTFVISIGSTLVLNPCRNINLRCIKLIISISAPRDTN